jgi:Tfp pilus assembly protein PilF
MRGCAFCVFAAVLAGVTLGSRPTEAAGPLPAFGASLEGRCRTTDGSPVPMGTMIRLETLDGQVAGEAPVDAAGSFQIEGLPRVKYVLTVNAKGFQPYSQQIDFEYTSTADFVEVVLTPISTVVHRPAPALTDLQAPKEAKKEFEKGQKALDGKNAKKAEQYLESAVKIYPCYARAQTDLGLTLSTLRKFEEAEKALKKAIQCDPGFLDSYTVLGQLLNAEKHYQESEAVLEEGLRLSPGAWQFYAELGTANFGQGKYPGAAQQFQKAEQMTPPPPADIHVKLANAYVKMESFDKAYTEMAAYLSADPNGPFAPRIKQIMGQMKAAGVIHPSPQAAGTP